MKKIKVLFLLALVVILVSSLSLGVFACSQNKCSDGCDKDKPDCPYENNSPHPSRSPHNTRPVCEKTIPVCEKTSTVCETATPVEETTTPVEETATPVEETTSPTEETATPAEETTAPAVEETPVETAVSPATEELPKTGEDSSNNIILFGITIIIAGLVSFVILNKRRVYNRS